MNVGVIRVRNRGISGGKVCRRRRKVCRLGGGGGSGSTFLGGASGRGGISALARGRWVLVLTLALSGEWVLALFPTAGRLSEHLLHYSASFLRKA